LALITLKRLLDHAVEKNLNYDKQVKIIYGGSLTPENSEVLFRMENIDGGSMRLCFIDPQFYKIMPCGL
jgi:triosephosphate isomerase